MHYLKHIKFGAYKSFQSLDVALNKGLNIVIGPNGSGKSNFLEILTQVISLVPEVLIDSLDQLNYELHFVDDKDEVQTTVEFRYSKKNINEHQIGKNSDTPNLVHYSLKCHTSGLLLLNIQKSGEVNHDILSSQLAIDLNEVKILVPKSRDLGFNIVSQEPFLDYPTTISKTGFKGVRVTHKPEYLISSLLIDAVFSSTQQIFDKSQFTTFDSFRFSKSVTSEFLELTLSIFNESERFSMIKSNLSWAADIRDIRINDIIYCRFERDTIFLENIQFEFLLNGNWIPWSGLSDGTKRLFLIISEILMSSDDVFLLEEPELGIHPHQLSKLMDFIKERSKQQQIILTTHSPQVLDVLDKDELDSVILCEMTDKGSQLRHLADSEKKKAIHYMENEAFLSDYWRFSDLENV